MLKRLIFPSLVTAVGLVGCANTFFPLAPDQLFETQLRANCSYAFNCCEAVERLGVSTPDEATCVEDGLETGGELSLLGQRAKAAIDAGTATYNAEEAERCMRPFLDAAQQCDPNLRNLKTDAACEAGLARAFVVGTVKDGKDCTDTLECADEGTCVVDAEDDTLTVKGKCVATAGEGDDCTERTCSSGLNCAFNAEDSTRTCEKVELLDDGESCFADSQCSSGACNESDTGACIDSEDPCDADSDCDEANGDFCSFPSTCGKPVEVESDICNGLE